MTTIEALRIALDGTLTRHQLDADNVLRGLYDLTGAQTVDVVSLGDLNGQSVDAWVDDEGAVSSVCNVAGTLLMGYVANAHRQPYFGPVVFLSTSDAGESTSLNEDTIEELTTAHRLLVARQEVTDAICLAMSEALHQGKL